MLLEQPEVVLRSYESCTRKENSLHIPLKEEKGAIGWILLQENFQPIDPFPTTDDDRLAGGDLLSVLIVKFISHNR